MVKEIGVVAIAHPAIYSPQWDKALVTIAGLQGGGCNTGSYNRCALEK